MPTFTTPIVNSKKADEHLLMIKEQHNDMLTGMEAQKMRVEQYNQVKRERGQIEQDRKMQQDNEKMKFGLQMRKDDFDMQNKQSEFARKDKELEIKKMALTSPE